MAAIATVARSRPAPADPPGSVLVLRNNDIGDLLVVTPLFEALRRRFPTTRIAAGVGDWNRPVLENNPFIDDVVPVNAPWHNQVIKPQSPFAALRYIVSSPESRQLASRRFDIGVDVLGSPWGSLLLMRAGIPYRLGVRGYAGGNRGAHKWVEFDSHVHVGQAALKFAELLGATELPSNEPQLYLTAAELDDAESLWRTLRQPGQRRRIVLGPGGGFPEKCWPTAHFATLVGHLADDASNQLFVVGGKEQRATGEQMPVRSGVSNLVGKTTLRALFALVARADLVICNSSMLMHVAAAFKKLAVVVLGEAMPPAADHAALWGFPNVTLVCGRERDGDPLATPAEILAIVSSAAERLKPSAPGS